MAQDTLLILCVIFTAYVFDFINGFHDAANAIATIVTTKVLTPRQAVIWAAIFNFVAFIFFKMTVAKTIGMDLIDSQAIDASLLFSALIASIGWGIATWYWGLPTSSSQALIGGLVGAAIMRGGPMAIKWLGFVKIILAIFLSPIVGLLLSFTLIYCLTHIFKKTDKRRLNTIFKSFQLFSSACLSLAHGTNDAQKTMGIITALLFSAHWLNGPFYVPFWVVISSCFVISLGTLFGGWRIVRTMGTGITHLNTMRGCSAETAAAVAVLTATEYGLPVSTTQTVTGAIAGVGLVQGLSGTCWPMLRLIFLSWLITMPVTGLVSALIMRVVQ
ncbi:MAG: inorganic phosphate transporter [Legionellaceae bacterium]|nr:inorganic phosphate transporter [Legionellaceae bacterium]